MGQPVPARDTQPGYRAALPTTNRGGPRARAIPGRWIVPTLRVISTRSRRESSCRAPRRTNTITCTCRTRRGTFPRLRPVSADCNYLRSNLKPGDLLFWENTYRPERQPPITPRHDFPRHQLARPVDHGRLAVGSRRLLQPAPQRSRCLRLRSHAHLRRPTRPGWDWCVTRAASAPTVAPSKPTKRNSPSPRTISGARAA